MSHLLQLLDYPISYILVAENKTESRQTHKQVTTEGGCSEGRAKHLEREKSEFDHVHGLENSLTKTDLH